jgi:aminopeptidase YwaD
MKTLKVIVIALCLAGCSSQIQRFDSAQITQEEIRQHLQTLASDEFGGRRTGEEGNRKAARYIADEFRRYGLTPMGDNGTFFQNFTFTASTKLGKGNSLRITTDGVVRNYPVNDQFRPISISPDTTLTAPLVFVGYGISLKDSVPYDDYDGIDAKGKIVVALRFSPDGITSKRFGQASSLLSKVTTAHAKGAAGIMLLGVPPDSTGVSPLIKFEYPERVTAGLAVCTMRWSDFDSLLRHEGKSLREVQAKINESKQPASFPLAHATASLQTQVEKIQASSANIIGYLQGSDPALRDELVIVGAHMDHLGMGGPESLKPDTVALHPGADDNGSGTAGLLELAQYFSVTRPALKRSVLFLSFSGEELGLLGSAYYVGHPSFPLAKSVAMLNMDMIGRMKDSVLIIEGMGTGSGFSDLVRQENRDSLDLRLKPDGYGPSDHASFYAKDLPVMFFFTSLHSDYHRPSDTWEKINYTGEEKVVRLVSRVTEDLANQPARPQFVKVAASAPAMGGDRQGVSVSLGVIPDYSNTEPGLKITGTRPGGPAEKAGLKADDTIVQFGGKAVTNIYDYMYMLGQYKPGDKVTLVVKRGKTEVTLEATLEVRK